MTKQVRSPFENETLIGPTGADPVYRRDTSAQLTVINPLRLFDTVAFLSARGFADADKSDTPLYPGQESS